MSEVRLDLDAALMQRIQADDTAAFAELYDRLAPRALGYAVRLCPDRHRAEDVVQDSFLSLWRRRAQYRPGQAPVIAWLFGILRNRAIDAQRREVRHSDRRGDLERAFDVLIATDHVEAEVIAADAARQLRQQLAELPWAQREVLTLAYYGQLSQSEIAEQLDVPLGTVKGRMRLALIKLRGDLTTGHPPSVITTDSTQLSGPRR